MLNKLFIFVLNMSLISSYAIVFVLIARLLLKKAPKIFSYVLWGVVLFRLACPFSFESVLSLMPTGKAPIPQDIIFSTAPQISTGVTAFDNVVNPILPVPSNFGASVNPIQIWLFIGAVIWVLGMVAMIIYSVVVYINLKRSLLSVAPYKENIYIADHIPSPFVMGLFKPKIYLPSSLTDNEKDFIIAHEMCHLRRLDHVTRILGFAILTLHWFNPLVWIAFIISARDMEMSCDEAVMKKMTTDIRTEYSQSLLRFSAAKRMIHATPLAFGEGDTKTRIKNVLSYKKPAFWVIIITGIAIIAVGLGLISNPKDNSSDPFSSSAKDVLSRYTLALASSDIAQMRQLMPVLNPPIQEVINTWSQIRIESVEVLSEDVRESKAMFELSVTVKEAPDGFGMWTPGTATHYLYVEKCDRGWYVESNGVGGRSQSDLAAWWNKPNLISGGENKGQASSAQPLRYFIMTDEIGAIGCEYGVNKNNELDTLQMLSELEKLQGFKLDKDWASHGYVKLSFQDGINPISVFLRYCASVDDIWQQEYPIDSKDYKIKVPSKEGTYSFFADITWGNGESETAYFSITVAKKETDPFTQSINLSVATKDQNTVASTSNCIIKSGETIYFYKNDYSEFSLAELQKISFEAELDKKINWECGYSSGTLKTKVAERAGKSIKSNMDIHKNGAYSFYIINNSSEQVNIKSLSISYQSDVAPLALTKETATEFINQTLRTFKLNSNNTLSFTLPAAIPTNDGGKTKLYISSSATFSPEPSTNSVQEMLDWKTDWQGGESYTEKLDVSRGKLTRLFLRVAFMTSEGENSYREYAANYVELIEPFTYDTPANITERSVEINEVGSSSVLKYTLQNGNNFSVSLTLPTGLTLSTSENYPEYAPSSDYEMPPIVVVKNGNPIGTLTLSRFGTDNKDDLTQMDTSENTLPMTIYSPIALSNHAQFNNYKVCKSSPTGANATAEYSWQDLTDYGGRAPEAPWLKSDSILAYDYEKSSFSININLANGNLNITERENLAKSIVIMS